MKNEIEMPDDLEICDDCGFEYPKNEIYHDTRTNSKVVGQFCKFCYELHEDNE